MGTSAPTVSATNVSHPATPNAVTTKPMRTPTTNVFAANRWVPFHTRSLANAHGVADAGSGAASLKQWVRHYNEGRPHMSLGPGLRRIFQAK
jgi:transposase InsO family protein